MRGGSREPILSKHLFYLLGGAAKIACEFHLFVAHLSDFRDCAFKVLFHQVSHGVELHAHLVNFVSARGPSQAAGK